MLEKLADLHWQLNTDSKTRLSLTGTESSANWVWFWIEMKTFLMTFFGRWDPLQWGRTPTLGMWWVFDSLLSGVIIQKQAFHKQGCLSFRKRREQGRRSPSAIFLYYLFDSSMIFLETTRDGCVDPPALGIEIRVCQLIYGKTESSCQASLNPRPISQFFIYLKNDMRQMFIQVVDQHGCFALPLAMWPFYCFTLPPGGGLGQGEKVSIRE